MNDRKQPGAAFWSTVVVVVVLSGYPVSVGPADCIEKHGLMPEWAAGPVYQFYAPLRWVRVRSPKRVRDAFDEYCILWWAN